MSVIPLQIRYHHVGRSEALTRLVREKAANLDRFFDRITSCRVAIEAPGRHHKKAPQQYRVRIDVTVPGRELVVGRNPLPDATSIDPYLAVTEAFGEMRRQLEDYARRRRELSTRAAARRAPGRPRRGPRLAKSLSVRG